MTSNKQKQFKQCLIKITPSLLNFCKSRIFNYSDAQDVCQQVVKILLEKANEFDPNKNFDAWAMRICSFQIKKYLTNKKRNREDCWVGNNDLLDPHPCPLENMKIKEKSTELKNQIDFLKNNVHPQEKKVFTYLLKGKSRQQTRELMGITANNFNAIYCRLINHCKKLIKNKN